MNSGIIDILAALRVNLVNKITWPFSCINKHKRVFIENDLPEPLPPVTMKYLLGLSNTRYLGFITP